MLIHSSLTNVNRLNNVLVSLNLILTNINKCYIIIVHVN